MDQNVSNFFHPTFSKNTQLNNSLARCSLSRYAPVIKLSLKALKAVTVIGRIGCRLSTGIDLPFELPHGLDFGDVLSASDSHLTSDFASSIDAKNALSSIDKEDSSNDNAKAVVGEAYLNFKKFLEESSKGRMEQVNATMTQQRASDGRNVWVSTSNIDAFLAADKLKDTDEAINPAKALSLSKPTNVERIEGVAAWTVEQVATWLRDSFKLENVAASAEAEEITGELAIAMDKNDWGELGCSGLKATKVMTALKKL